MTLLCYIDSLTLIVAISRSECSPVQITLHFVANSFSPINLISLSLLNGLDKNFPLCDAANCFSRKSDLLERPFHSSLERIFSRWF